MHESCPEGYVAGSGTQIQTVPRSPGSGANLASNGATCRTQRVGRLPGESARNLRTVNRIAVAPAINGRLVHKQGDPFLRRDTVIGRAAEEFDPAVEMFDQSRVAEAGDQFRLVRWEPGESRLQFHDDLAVAVPHNLVEAIVSQRLRRRGRRAGNQYSSSHTGKEKGVVVLAGN